MSDYTDAVDKVERGLLDALGHLPPAAADDEFVVAGLLKAAEGAAWLRGNTPQEA